MAAIRKAKNGALARPTRKCCTPMSVCSSDRNMAGEISSDRAHTTAPPTMPQIIARKVSSGNEINSANTRGTTSSSMGLRPRVRMASISSLAFIEPICAVKALAVRPAMRMAVNSTANSRKNENATRSTVKRVAPNAASTVAPRNATTAPTRKVSKATMGAASRPVCSMCATTGVSRQRWGWKARRSKVSRIRPTKPSNCRVSCQTVLTARPIRSSSNSSTGRSASLTGMQ
ncbi:hypothetical protein D3C76_610800 [compost metagenome]